MTVSILRLQAVARVGSEGSHQAVVHVGFKWNPGSQRRQQPVIVRGWRLWHQPVRILAAPLHLELVIKALWTAPVEDVSKRPLLGDRGSSTNMLRVLTAPLHLRLIVGHGRTAPATDVSKRPSSGDFSPPQGILPGSFPPLSSPTPPSFSLYQHLARTSTTDPSLLSQEPEPEPEPPPMCKYVRSRFRCGCHKLDFGEPWWCLKTQCAEKKKSGRCPEPQYLHDDEEDFQLGIDCSDDECPGWSDESREKATKQAAAESKLLLAEHEAEVAEKEQDKKKKKKKHRMR
ncbi:hypothetical protein B0T21DRAFT_406943 [Apiosordaria backusii]|uniref:Uncharacterized protein n=1 Tax=Apiosordaria backusii TaxID=314023 RepID=A0AA40K754_9PEZI|nr:hypothetical protein B0T21DRAFT_406943 [Apiosordaria backusii]